MKPQIITISLIAIFCTASCKKEKQAAPVTPVDSNTVVTYANYTNLKPGNYWIYQQFTLDSLHGTATALPYFDSCYVEKDTLINNINYHKYCAPVYGSGTPSSYEATYLRDSLSYTVNSKGGIIFSSLDFSTVFKTTTYSNPLAGITDTITITYQMGFKDSMITVPAGTFKTSTYRQIYHMPPPKYMFGPERDYDNSYAEHVGLVRSTLGMYAMPPTIVERRLVRYHL